MPSIPSLWWTSVGRLLLAAFVAMILGSCQMNAGRPPSASPIDGRYVKLDPSPPQWWACRRCADYRPAGGIWRLELADDTMEIVYDIQSWRSLARFELDGDRLRLTGDGVCPETSGEYRWHRDQDQLTLVPIADDCSFGLRAQNLGKQPWQLCPSVSTGDSATAEGCAPEEPPEAYRFAGTEPTVAVIPGIAADFKVPPRQIFDANPGNRPPPTGVEVLVSPTSIPYGRNLVIWAPGDSVEVAVGGEADALGVQFHGDAAIGWARVWFDDLEVWRGDTSAIWSFLGRFGGYLEIGGFSPGRHQLRVEALGVERRPITIAYFGLGKVQP